MILQTNYKALSVALVWNCRQNMKITLKDGISYLTKGNIAFRADGIDFVDTMLGNKYVLFSDISQITKL